MSELLNRGLRRQRAIQESRSTAWVIFSSMLVVLVSALLSLIALARAGATFSPAGVLAAAVVTASAWVAAHLYGETRRLGRLLKDRRRILRAEHSPELEGGVRWSNLNPFVHWRD